MNSLAKLNLLAVAVTTLLLTTATPAEARVGVALRGGGFIPGTQFVLTPSPRYAFPIECEDPDENYYAYCLQAYPQYFYPYDGGYYFLGVDGVRHIWHNYYHHHDNWHHGHHDHHGHHGEHHGGHHGGGHHGDGHHGGGHHGGGHHGGGHHGGGHHGGGHHGGGHH